MSQADDSPPELRSLLERLADPDPARQEDALRELRDRASKKSLSTSDGAFLLRAAAKEYPPIKENPTNCVAAELIRAVASTPDRSYVAIVREIFDALRPPPRPWPGLGDPQLAALDLLARMDDEAAAQLLLELLERSVAAGSPLLLPVGSLRWKPRLAQVYFPRMLESAKGKAAQDVFAVCFDYARRGALPPERLAPHAGVLVDAYARMRPEDRDTAVLLLDLMGYFPSPEVEPVLNAATKLADLTLAGYAACALLRLGRDVDVGLLERLGASPQKRSWLFDELRRSGRLELFPLAWATQTALAEGVMVQWLVHPNELGCAPDEIELVKVVVDDGPPDGVLEWYLFRFRVMQARHWACEKGWMTGLAGPFKQGGGPTVADHGRTWSDFTRWDSMTLEQHLERVRETVRRFRQSRSKAN